MNEKKVNVLKSIYDEYHEDISDFGFSIAFARVISKVNIPFISYSTRNEYLWNKVYKYVKNKYQREVEREVNTYSGEISIGNDDNIWVMWWQGEKNMPEIIRMCFNRLKKVSKDKNVVLITKDNYNEFIQIPEIIMKKYNDGKISITHLSDVIRCILLRDYGGLWIDSSIYASYLAIDWNAEFYTLRTHGQLTNYFSKGDWSTFVLYCKNANSLLMKNMCALYEQYWKEHNKAIIYEMPDYFIRLIVEKSNIVQKQISNVPDSFDYRLFLGIMNEPYNQERIDKILRKSPLQKMSYKYLCNKQINGQLTNYGHLMQK